MSLQLAAETIAQVTDPSRPKRNDEKLAQRRERDELMKDYHTRNPKAGKFKPDSTPDSMDPLSDDAIAHSQRVANDIEARLAAIEAGDLSCLTQVLLSQAIALDQMFHNHCRLAMSQSMGSNFGRYAHVALRAQEQSRKAVLAILELKNPRRAMFVKNQNNLLQVGSEPYAPLEPGSQGEAISIDPPVEAVGVEYRADNGTRENR